MIRIIQNCCPWFSCCDPKEDERELVQTTPTGYGLYLGPVDPTENSGDLPIQDEQ